MNKYLFVLFCVVCCSFSCASQKKEVVTKSTIKLEGKNTNIRDLIDIDGVYAYSTMFFDDGTWVNFSMKENNNGKIDNLSDSIIQWKDGKTIRWGNYWGVYTIQNDTIIVYSYDRPALLKGWGLDEIRYKIIDKQSILRVYDRSMLKSADDYYKTHSPWRNYPPIHFTPADSLPSSDNWLKENKWIWRNEADWKEYMDRIKQKKRVEK